MVILFSYLSGPVNSFYDCNQSLFFLFNQELTDWIQLGLYYQICYRCKDIDGEKQVNDLFCGVDNYEVKVCCDEEEILFDSLPPQPPR